MKKVQRLVLDANVPQILSFEQGSVLSGFQPSISYDYLEEPTVKKRCPRGTRLVATVARDDKINSAIGYGQGAFFLLGNEDCSRMGRPHLGFIDSFDAYSLRKLEDDVHVDKSFFVDIYDSNLSCKKKSVPHLLLSRAYGGGWTSLHELDFGSVDIGSDKFCGTRSDLVWLEKAKSFLILEEGEGFLDSNRNIVKGFDGQVGSKNSLFGEAVSRIHYVGGSLMDKLVHSPSYETALVLD